MFYRAEFQEGVLPKDGGANEAQGMCRFPACRKSFCSQYSNLMGAEDGDGTSLMPPALWEETYLDY